MNIILIKIAECCWSISGSENISEARHLHGIDMEYTPYPRQYLMDFADLDFFFKKRLNATKGVHYCYAYSSFNGLQYAMNHGIPRRAEWKSSECEINFFS